ncbi:transcriptional regulator FeaR [Pseudomonas sp. B21-056]|jgi:AraC family transcriptional activator of tynA and feaB|uniref:transcriptional regulator FeaR n=1 Tax=Pseudomonas sp. B21-056 TaxID=2895495 RepID=UPI002230E709|nr:transcriptional regulator FeaR [Pseudomonas sp. B21-056]UZE21400.1 transcriptional regulator FeaR [Pseudomonas sp. B21-056]
MHSTGQTEPFYTGRQGFEAWHHDLAEKCGTFHAEPPTGSGATSFTGAMQNLSGSHPVLDGSRIISNCRHLHRARQDIRADDKDFYYLVLQVGGRAKMCQADNQARLGAGDLVLLDITQPCDFYFDDLSDQMSLIIPRHALQQRLGQRQPLFNQPLGATSTLGSMAGLLTQRLFDSSRLQPEEAFALFDALLALLRPGISTAPECENPGVQAQKLVKAKVLIEQYLRDSELSPERLAKAIGTSVRNLHRLFAQHDTSVGRYILEHRLQRCAESIARAAPQEKITAIAYAWGFNDVSHFSKAFKTRFGVSPRDYRYQNAATVAQG